MLNIGGAIILILFAIRFWHEFRKCHRLIQHIKPLDIPYQASYPTAWHTTSILIYYIKQVGDVQVIISFVYNTLKKTPPLVRFIFNTENCVVWLCYWTYCGSGYLDFCLPFDSDTSFGNVTAWYTIPGIKQVMSDFYLFIYLFLIIAFTFQLNS